MKQSSLCTLSYDGLVFSLSETCHAFKDQTWGLCYSELTQSLDVICYTVGYLHWVWLAVVDLTILLSPLHQACFMKDCHCQGSESRPSAESIITKTQFIEFIAAISRAFLHMTCDTGCILQRGVFCVDFCKVAFDLQWIAKPLSKLLLIIRNER